MENIYENSQEKVKLSPEEKVKLEYIISKIDTFAENEEKRHAELLYKPTSSSLGNLLNDAGIEFSEDLIEEEVIDHLIDPSLFEHDHSEREAGALKEELNEIDPGAQLAKKIQNYLFHDLMPSSSLGKKMPEFFSRNDYWYVFLIYLHKIIVSEGAPDIWKTEKRTLEKLCES